MIADATALGAALKEAAARAQELGGAPWPSARACDEGVDTGTAPLRLVALPGGVSAASVGRAEREAGPAVRKEPCM